MVQNMNKRVGLQIWPIKLNSSFKIIAVWQNTQVFYKSKHAGCWIKVIFCKFDLKIVCFLQFCRRPLRCWREKDDVPKTRSGISTTTTSLLSSRNMSPMVSSNCPQLTGDLWLSEWSRLPSMLKCHQDTAYPTSDTCIQLLAIMSVVC